MLHIDELNIDELQDTIVGAITNIIIDKIADFLWDEVSPVIDDIFTPSARQQVWQQIAQRLAELADNIRIYAEQLARQ
jgi:hypothetical protein